VKKYIYHGEDVSVIIDEDVESQMRHIQKTMVDYERCDVYNGYTGGELRIIYWVPRLKLVLRKARLELRLVCVEMPMEVRREGLYCYWTISVQMCSGRVR